MNNEAGKGDTYRPVDYQKYCDNWDKIFSNKEDKNIIDESKDKNAIF
jgi:hypothetical protein